MGSEESRIVNVYFIQMGLYGPIKIGVAQDVGERLKSLQVGNPYPLRVLKTVAGSTRVESHLHYMFRDERMQGEWFEPSARLRSLIANDRMLIKAIAKPIGIDAAFEANWQRLMTKPDPLRCEVCGVHLMAAVSDASVTPWTLDYDPKTPPPGMCSACAEAREMGEAA